MIITIDGPAGTGKTTVAQQVAQRLAFRYFDTGALYRAVTLFALSHGISENQEERLVAALRQNFDFSIALGDEGKEYFLNGENVTKAIRSEEVTHQVSVYAALQKVRSYLVTIQHDFARIGNTVVEGRDMGTVVFPEAHWKFFLTASLEVRARRRYLQDHPGGDPLPQELDALAQEIERRDSLDQTRAHSPLKKADDAIELDTSRLTLEEVVNYIVRTVRG